MCLFLFSSSYCVKTPTNISHLLPVSCDSVSPICNDKVTVVTVSHLYVVTVCGSVSPICSDKVTVVTVSHLYVVTVCGRGNPPLAPPCTEEAAVIAAYLDSTVTVPG